MGFDKNSYIGYINEQAHCISLELVFVTNSVKEFQHKSLGWELKTALISQVLFIAAVFDHRNFCC
jgi:hypothetical protein